MDNFFSRDPRNWKIEEFIKSYMRLHPLCSLEKLSQVYVESLEIIVATNDSKRKRTRAERLLEDYNKDKTGFSKIWEKNKVLPAVVMNSTFTFGNFENNGSFNLDASHRLSCEGNNVDQERVDDDDCESGGEPAGNNPENVKDWGNLYSRKKRPTKSDALKEEFIRRYRIMDRTLMWRLKTGTIVEDCIYNAVLSTRSIEGSAYQWIINFMDPWVKNFFTAEEWDEIFEQRTAYQSIKSVTEDCLRLLLTYQDVTSMDELQSVLLENSGGTQKYHLWIDHVMRNIRVLLSHPKSPLLSTHGENWYEVNVWGPIFDFLFLLATDNFEIDRTQTGKGSYLVTGQRSDAIIRAIGSHSPLEYGAVEAKPSFTGETSTTFLDDYEKIMSTINDMLSRLVSSVSTVDVPKLTVVGVLTAGLHYKCIQMWTPNGQIYVTQPGRLHQVPTDIQSLSDIIPLLLSIWQLKETVVSCQETVSRSNRLGSLSSTGFI